jgi:hypothetical protein
MKTFYIITLQGCGYTTTTTGIVSGYKHPAELFTAVRKDAHRAIVGDDPVTLLYYTEKIPNDDNS